MIARVENDSQKDRKKGKRKTNMCNEKGRRERKKDVNKKRINVSTYVSACVCELSCLKLFLQIFSHVVVVA